MGTWGHLCLGPARVVDPVRWKEGRVLIFSHLAASVLSHSESMRLLQRPPTWGTVKSQFAWD